MQWALSREIATGSSRTNGQRTAIGLFRTRKRGRRDLRLSAPALETRSTRARPCLGLKRLKIKIRGASHLSFSDQMLIKSQALLGLARMLGAVHLDGRRGLAITADYVHSFFDVYLKGKPRTVLDTLASRYPEVMVE